jgi:hypothetical protein
MAIIYSEQNLFENTSCELLFEKLLLNNFFKEFTTLAKLCNQVDVFLIFKVLVQLQNLRVVESLKDFNFGFESIPIFYFLPADSFTGP